MVFAINAVENSPNNFAAFLALAQKINGTATGAPTATGTGSVKAIAGAIEGDSESQSSKELLRNSYIVIGLAGAGLLCLIVLIILVLGKGGLKGRPGSRSGPRYQKPGELEKLEESLSFTHPSTSETRYSD
jgi:hypothetical protein